MARILIVEDNPANMKLAVFILERNGHQAIQALDAETGLLAARGQRPDLILMDVQLPGMDGLEATRLLKADPVTCAIPVLALTAMAMRGDEERVRAAGCDGYIAKPIDHKTLIAQVQRALTPSA
ncbi:response regulator [Noviherbaspirillum denitrificans]|uniref:Response regulator receiver protein n=1 Tax=Noviherbaspirillum denitrificans TaxID=1968433 RepID=A0A254TG81_9BURK|nr:response regulator [Noviherbaspirillum denitrificans]OWW21666.1 response regulator receiver protein [Noviherbaspirillum denitrificans]